LSTKYRFTCAALLTALLLLGSAWLKTGRAPENAGNRDAPGVQQGADRPAALFVPRRMLVKFRAGTPDERARGLLAAHGARVANVSYNIVSSATVSRAARYFQREGGVVTIAAGN
jgi:hypothetical protein